MPQQINSSSDFYVNLESDITGADATNDGTTSGNASTQPNIAVGYYNSSLPTVSDGAGAAFQIDSSGRLLVGSIATALPAGTNNIGDVDVVSLIPGTGATNLGKAEDAAHSSGDTGIMALAVRTDTPAAKSGADGDYEPLQVRDGILWASAPSSDIKNLTPTLDTSAYAAGDVLFTDTEISGAVLASGRTSILQSVVAVDKDNQGPSIVLYFFDREPSNGTYTANAAFDLNDTDAGYFLGSVSLDGFVSSGNSQVSTTSNIGMILKPNSGTSVWVIGVINSTTTHTASGMNLSFGFFRE